MFHQTRSGIDRRSSEMALEEKWKKSGKEKETLEWTRRKPGIVVSVEGLCSEDNTGPVVEHKGMGSPTVRFDLFGPCHQAVALTFNFEA
jgi:hypothetical protein